MTTTLKRFSLAIIGLGLMAFGATALLTPAHAQDEFEAGEVTGALNQTVSGTGFDTGSTDENQIFDIIGNIINVLLGLLGIIFFLYLVWAGFIWMTAQGDSGKVDKARTMITQSVIGIIIILAAAAIANFAVNAILDAVTA